MTMDFEHFRNSVAVVVRSLMAIYDLAMGHPMPMFAPIDEF